jgi:hypothetical protein
MQIDERDEQLANALASMDESVEPNSKMTVNIWLNPEKEDLRILATEEGR